MEKVEESIEAETEKTEEVTKKYEDFTSQEFKDHIAATASSEETVTMLGAAFYSKFPNLIIHPRELETVVLQNREGELAEGCDILKVGEKVRSTVLKNRER